MNICRIKNINECIYEALEYNKSFKSCHVAFLIKGTKIVSYGYNKMDRNCCNGRFVRSVHAEVDCLNKRHVNGVKKLHKCKLVVIKIDRKHNYEFIQIYTDSRPCDCCAKFITDKGFKTFYASTDDGLIKKFNIETYEPFKIQQKIF